MKIVVTGASGNVGTAVVRRLSEHPEVTSVVGVCRRPHRWGPPRTIWRYLDVARDNLGPAFDGADAVVHLAWLFHPARRPEVTWEANVLGTRAVLDAVTTHGVPAVVVASSVGAYSPGESDQPVAETWPTFGWPTAAYSREKAFVERMLDSFEMANGDVRVVRMRPAFTFQESSAVQQRRLFVGPFVPMAALSRGRLPVLPLPAGLRIQAAHTDDVADAYVAATIRQVSGAFNLAADGVLGVEELADVLGTRAVQTPSPLVRAALAGAFHLRLAPAEPGLLDLALRVPVMSSRRAREELDWSPTHDARESLLAFLSGTDGRGGPTPPLAPSTSGPFRIHEFATGVGARP